MTNTDASLALTPGRAHVLLTALLMAPNNGAVFADRFSPRDVDALRALDRLGFVVEDRMAQSFRISLTGADVLARARSAALGVLGSTLFDAAAALR